jgi:hypothetical protein
MAQAVAGGRELTRLRALARWPGASVLIVAVAVVYAAVFAIRGAVRADGQTASACPAAAPRPGLVADFGHAISATKAAQIQARAASHGFQGLVVEQVGCTDFRVALHGIPNASVGASLRDEARKAGLTVVIDQQ